MICPDKNVVIVAANPKSGARSRNDVLQSLTTRLEQRGFVVELHTDLQSMAASATERNQAGLLRAVVAAGGDGTAAIVSSLIPSNVPIVLFPLGSENLLARYVGATIEPIETVAAIERLACGTMDVTLVNGKTSLLMTTIGYDAEVVRRVHLARKSHVTKAAYWWGIVRTLLRYRWPAITVTLYDATGTEVAVCEACWFFAFNVPRYASGLVIIDDADCNDGMMDVGMFSAGGLLHGMRCFQRVRNQTHRSDPSWKQYRVHKAVIQTTDPSRANETSYQIDGDWGGHLPVTIEMSNRKLILVQPSEVTSTTSWGRSN